MGKVKRLIKSLKNDENYLERARAARALGTLADPKALETSSKKGIGKRPWINSRN